MYISVMKEMRKKERSIFTQEVDGNQILVARENCDNLYDTLGDIEFTLQGTKIVITPRGYLYRLPDQNSDCFIGIQSIPDSAN